MTPWKSGPDRFRFLDQIVYWGLMVQVVILPLKHNDTLLSLAFLAALLALVLNRLLGRIRLAPTGLDLAFLVFGIAAAASVLFSVDPAETMDEIRADIVIPAATFYLAAWGLRTGRQLRGLSRAAVVALAVLNLYGIGHFFLAGGDLASYFYREASLAQDYHYLGTYLVVAFPLALVLALTETSERWRTAAKGVALLTPLGVYITYDRGCWLALALMGLGLYPLFIQRLKTYFSGLVAAVVLVWLLIPPSVLVHGDRTTAQASQGIEASTITQRLVVWSYCLRCIEESPLIGIGYGRHNFTVAFPEFYQYYKRFQLWHCHNTYLDLALQLGLLGLAAFLFLAAAGLRMTFLIWSRAGPARLWGAAGLLCLAGFLVRVTGDSFYVDEHIRLLWLILGATAAAGRMEAEGWSTS